jgi:hypothetical protein
MRLALASLVLIVTPLLPAQQRLLSPDDVPARQTASRLLNFGIDALRTLGPTEGGERLLAALQTARLCLADGSAARSAVEVLLAEPAAPATLLRSVQALAADLTFQPVAEAALPAGVPGFLGLDELELRHYPAYRMVRTEMKGGTFGAFWQLFQHIQEHQIAMTTPVQVDYRADAERTRQASMAFLYGSRELGDVGQDGTVEVVDVAPHTVLTIGSRGFDRPDRIAALRARLEAWLANHPEWVATGEMRTMGYNSPSVRGERRYFEVQIPVQPRAAAPKERQSM